MHQMPNQGPFPPSFPPPPAPIQPLQPSPPPASVAGPMGGNPIPMAPLLLDLILFPVRCVISYLSPFPFIVKAESQCARWETIWIFLFFLPPLIGGCTYAMNFFPLLPIWGIHPFTPETVGSLVGSEMIGIPSLFFIAQGLTIYLARRMQETGTFLTQCFTALLSLSITVSLLTIVGAILFTNPSMHSDARLWLIMIASMALIYGHLHLAVTVCTIHHLPLSRGMLLSLMPLLGILVVIIVMVIEGNYLQWYESPQQRQHRAAERARQRNSPWRGWKRFR